MELTKLVSRMLQDEPGMPTGQSTLAAQIAASPLRSLHGLLFALQFRMRNYTFTTVLTTGSALSPCASTSTTRTAAATR